MLDAVSIPDPELLRRYDLAGPRERFDALFRFERMFEETLRTYRSLSERSSRPELTTRDTQVMR